jgi:heme/copper-type cytochrome/quinol oxidase subunit 2
VVQVGKPVQFKVRSADTKHTFVIEAFGIDMEVPQKALDAAALTPVITPKEVGTFRIHCRNHERLPMQATLQVAAGN